MKAPISSVSRGGRCLGIRGRVMLLLLLLAALFLTGCMLLLVETSPQIEISTPNGGEAWAVGSTQYIEWTSSSAGNAVRIKYSTDEGTTWRAISASAPNTGVYAWNIPNTPSGSCVVRVISVDAPSTTDDSNGVFEIVEAGSNASVTTFVDVDGSTVATYQTGELIYVKVVDPTHAGATLLANAVEIDGIWYDLAPAGPAGTFMTDGLDLGLAAGDEITATYTDPTDAANSSSDTISILGTTSETHRLTPEFRCNGTESSGCGTIFIPEGFVRIIEHPNGAADYYYPADATITLRASEEEAGWVFISWSGDASGTSSRITITMDRDRTVVADYEQAD